MALLDIVPVPVVTLRGRTTTGSERLDRAELYLVSAGPFVDYHPRPRGGLHFQVMAGAAWCEILHRGVDRGDDPAGLVLVAGAGHEWWIGPNMSLGLMARLSQAWLWLDYHRYDVRLPALVGTFSFN